MDISLSNMTKDDVMNEIRKIKENIANNQQAIERQKQQVYEAKNIQSKRAIQNQEQIREIEHSRAKSSENLNILKRQHATAMGEVNKIQRLYAEQSQEQESELLENQTCLKRHQEELEQLEIDKITSNVSMHDDAKSKEMLKALQELQTQFTDLQELCSEQIVKTNLLQTKFNAKTIHVKTLQDTCNWNKTEIEEANTQKDTLECDLIVLQGEAHGLGLQEEISDKPMSLFDEVNVNRTIVQDSCVNMSKVYEDMKKKRNDLFRQLTSLHSKKALLKFKCTESKDAAYFDKFVVDYTYANLISTLKYLNEQLKYLGDERDLLMKKPIDLRETEIFFKVFNRMENKCSELDAKFMKTRHTKLNTQYKITYNMELIEVLNKKIVDERKSNDDLIAVIEIADKWEIGNALVCICNLK